jgi:hypothetical protein
LRALALGLQVVVMVAATVATAEELQELPELVLDLATLAHHLLVELVACAGSDGAALAGGDAQAANGPGAGGDGYWGGEGGADGAVGVAPYGGGGGGSRYVPTDALTSRSLTGFGGQGAHGSSIGADDSSPGQNGKVLIIDNATTS